MYIQNSNQAPTFGRRLLLPFLEVPLDGRGACSLLCWLSFSRRFSRFSRFSRRSCFDLLVTWVLPPSGSPTCPLVPIIIDPVVSDILIAAPSNPLRLPEPSPSRDSFLISAAFCRVFSTSSALCAHHSASLVVNVAACSCTAVSRTHRCASRSARASISESLSSTICTNHTISRIA